MIPKSGSRLRTIMNASPTGSQIAAQHTGGCGRTLRLRVVAGALSHGAEAGTVVELERRPVSLLDLEKNRPHAETGETP